MDIHSDPDKYQSLSPFKVNFSSFQEIGPKGDNVVISRGATLPEIARVLYELKKPIEHVTANFNFLSRDLFKEREYKPDVEDKFVFNSNASIKEFKDRSLNQLAQLVAIGRAMGLPIVKDDKKGVELIDSDAISLWMNPKHEYHQLLLDKWDDISSLLANQDIMKKYCIVRAVNIGWWVNSYAGKKSAASRACAPALRAFEKAVTIIRKSSKYKDLYKQLEDEVGDPLLTNSGWPYYGSRVVDGIPVDKVRTVKLFAGIGVQYKDYSELAAAFSHAARQTPFGRFPFAMAPLRRSQYGNKNAHMFRYSSVGLTYAFDRTGLNSVRTAWMAAYVYNLLLSPMQREIKAIRMMIPGCYHDGATMKRRHDRRRQARYYIAEADYSNYDRFIPIDILEELITIFCNGYEKKTLIASLARSTFHDMSLVWPDSTGGAGDVGLMISPKLTGLFSGVKPTAEWGSFVNCIINSQALIDAGILTEEGLVQYLTQYVNSEIGTKEEYFYVQSDDTLLLNKDVQKLDRQATAFSRLAKIAGIKSSLQLGDRFLMRHLNRGRDNPVPARVFQNTLSNETPPDDEETFTVGLAVRSDGMLGHKTFDPFDTGKNQGLTRAQLMVEVGILKDLTHFLKTAKRPVQPAVELTEIMYNAGNRLLNTISTNDDEKFASNSLVHLPPEVRSNIDIKRHDAMKALAELTLKKSQLLPGMNRLQQMMDELMRDKHSPSSAYLLDYIKAHYAAFSDSAVQLVNKENSFYKYAMETVNIPLDIHDW